VTTVYKQREAKTSFAKRIKARRKPAGLWSAIRPDKMNRSCRRGALYRAVAHLQRT